MYCFFLAIASLKTEDHIAISLSLYLLLFLSFFPYKCRAREFLENAWPIFMYLSDFIDIDLHLIEKTSITPFIVFKSPSTCYSKLYSKYKVFAVPDRDLEYNYLVYFLSELFVLQ